MKTCLGVVLCSNHDLPLGPCWINHEMLYFIFLTYEMETLALMNTQFLLTQTLMVFHFDIYLFGIKMPSSSYLKLKKKVNLQ